MLPKKQAHQQHSAAFKSTLFFIFFLASWVFLIFFCLPPTNPTHSIVHHLDNNRIQPQPSISFYVYDLPPEFNLALLNDCHHLNIYTDMCPHVANHGLGQPVGRILTDCSCWYATHQFLAEMIFHARLENHRLRTRDPSRATLFYLPFYAGLHASSNFREKNLTARDELAVRFSRFLESQPWWRRTQGRDHFIVLGRTAWDFMRTEGGGSDFGANCLLNLPRVNNMSVLTIERNPWRRGSDHHGIPYPSYFHPYTSSQMQTWQDSMRLSERPHLFSFIGAPRKGVQKASIRDELIQQCAESARCKLLTCKTGGSSACFSPGVILGVMSKSQFCLQAPGDSFTRRSTFDSVLAGCIPVFFSPHTAYTQYAWYLPDDAGEYSVYIDGEKRDGRRRIEDELMKIPRERVETMRRRVIEMIPRVTYKHPSATDDDSFEDAVDVALAALATPHKFAI